LPIKGRGTKIENSGYLTGLIMFYNCPHHFSPILAGEPILETLRWQATSWAKKLKTQVVGLLVETDLNQF
jgi:hypothetical protein